MKKQEFMHILVFYISHSFLEEREWKKKIEFVCFKCNI